MPGSTLTTRQLALVGACVCVATATAVWFSSASLPEGQVPPPVQAVVPPGAMAQAPGSDASRLAAGGEAGDSTATTPPASAALEVLLAQAMNASHSPAEGEAARDKLRKLAKEDPATARWLIQSYDKPYFSRSRSLIVALLLEIETPEVLAFSKRLASSPDVAQQRDGFVMLQHLHTELPEVRSIVLQALSAQGSTESVLMALAVLKPPAPATTNSPQTDAASNQTAAVVTQLQNLTRHAAPEVRVESVLQLAQWDASGGSQPYWASALADPSPRVREAAVVAVALSGAQSALLKSALLRLASNPRESNDIRGNAVQLLAGFALSQDEARDLGKLRAQFPSF